MAILVDHNELSQAVDGIEEAEILEIIDHHRVGDISHHGADLRVQRPGRQHLHGRGRHHVPVPDAHPDGDRRHPAVGHPFGHAAPDALDHDRARPHDRRAPGRDRRRRHPVLFPGAAAREHQSRGQERGRADRGGLQGVPDRRQEARREPDDVPGLRRDRRTGAGAGGASSNACAWRTITISRCSWC